MPFLDPLESVAASELVSSALIASLIPALVERGVITPHDAHEIYENALLCIETLQADEPAVERIFQVARQLIETRLRPEH
jgi:hypothetical protein